MNKKKTFRRMKYLASKCAYCKPEVRLELSKYTWHTDVLDCMIELNKLFDAQGYTEEQRESFHKEIHKERKVQRAEYYKKPLKERKDNKDVINFGNGPGRNRNRIRYPKKCRKTAWKRFAKLFPDKVKIVDGKIVKK